MRLFYSKSALISHLLLLFNSLDLFNLNCKLLIVVNGSRISDSFIRSFVGSLWSSSSSSSNSNSKTQLEAAAPLPKGIAKEHFSKREYIYNNKSDANVRKSSFIHSDDKSSRSSYEGGFIPDQFAVPVISSKQGFLTKPIDPTKRPKIPGFPADPPIPQINLLSNIVTLINLASTDSEIDDQAEVLLVETIKQVISAIGLQDVRDLMGMFLMYFVLGPIMLPLYWMPIAIMAMGFLMIPVIYNSPAVLAAGGVGRSFSGGVTSREGVSQQESFCLEMISCEVSNFARGSRVASWISGKLNLTKVEWASGGDENHPHLNRGSGGHKKKRRRASHFRKGGFISEEDCSKYSCGLMKPVQRFFGTWYSYFFTFQNNSLF